MTGRRRPVVAVDGPAGAGKSTVARLAAERLGYLYVDTGAMYRAVGLACLREGIALDDHVGVAAVARGLGFRFVREADGSVRVLANDEDVTDAVRTEVVGAAASRVGLLPEVRAALVAAQREVGRMGGIVMEGRDIQTNVFPEAEVKIFLTASVAERARRRVGELELRGHTPPPLEEVVRAIAERDQRDSERPTAPLAQAPDATAIDTDGLSIEEVVSRVVELARAAEGAMAT